jgi:hypothetical protein
MVEVLAPALDFVLVPSSRGWLATQCFFFGGGGGGPVVVAVVVTVRVSVTVSGRV